MLKKIAIVVLGVALLGAAAQAATTVYTNVFGQVVTVVEDGGGRTTTISAPTYADNTMGPFEQAATYSFLDVLFNAQVQGNLAVRGALTAEGGLGTVNTAGTAGYIEIQGSNLVFITTATNGVALTVPSTNIVAASITP